MLASGSNDRQVIAIVDGSRRKCAWPGTSPPAARAPGGTLGPLLDYVDIVVHIQHQEERAFYALDRLWRDCPVIDVDLGAPPQDGS